MLRFLIKLKLRSSHDSRVKVRSTSGGSESMELEARSSFRRDSPTPIQSPLIEMSRLLQGEAIITHQSEFNQSIPETVERAQTPLLF